MIRANYADEYRKNAVQGASPLQLVIMLYDGAIRFIDAGIVAIGKKDIATQNDKFQKAQRIVMELMSCLDMDKGNEVAKNLLALYSYALNELVTANLEDDIAPAQRARRVLEDLRSGWVELEEQLRPQNPDAEVRLAA